MARCAYCGSTIIAGGARAGGLRFCNANCQNKGAMMLAAQELPADLVEDAVLEAHQGDCPKCHGPGPVDVHTSHRIVSVLVATQWSTRTNVCCVSCGRKAKLADVFYCLFLGWWGFPWGLLGTPVQILRNLAGMVSGPNPHEPSVALHNIVSVQMARELWQAEQQAQIQDAPHG
ncbi:hypothetical protein HED60_09160 [Planctomycetales bacterium ZRK34]|nr:hypothetical protein HED60_09160 [Planctomycetales bacterium ZRK34]